jgi:predicted 2-oxoglutarate/Fe(II)-dependent dioxygenase YbiX
VFEPGLCRALINLYEERGGTPSGFMRQGDGGTYGVMDNSFKRRNDVNLEGEAAWEPLRHAIRNRVARRVAPAIQQAFNVRITRIERYIVACYDAAEGGFFRPHRDNLTQATAHRRFAVTINLNADDYEGGDLRFPEFGQRTYRAPTGGAVVFGCGLLHEATPVTRGRRYACLPFLYDEEGARVRERNRQFLSSEVVDKNVERTAAPAS